MKFYALVRKCFDKKIVLLSQDSSQIIESKKVLENELQVKGLYEMTILDIPILHNTHFEHEK